MVRAASPSAVFPPRLRAATPASCSIIRGTSGGLTVTGTGNHGGHRRHHRQQDRRRYPHRHRCGRADGQRHRRHRHLPAQYRGRIAQRHAVEQLLEFRHLRQKRHRLQPQQQHDQRTNGTNSATNAEEASIRFDNLLTSAAFTTATITNSNISGGAASNLYIANTSGTLNRLTMTGNTFGFVSSTIGNNNLDIQAYNSGTTLNVTFGGDAAGQGNTITGTRGAAFETIANQNTTMDVVFRHNTITNTEAIISGGGEVDIRSGAAGGTTNLTFDISHNAWTAPTTGTVSAGAAFFVAHDNDAGTMSGTINANTVDGGANFNTGDGIFVRASGSGTATVLITNNTVQRYSNAGIALQNNSGSSTMNASVFGNTTMNPGSGARAAIYGFIAENGGDVRAAGRHEHHEPGRRFGHQPEPAKPFCGGRRSGQWHCRCRDRQLRRAGPDALQSIEERLRFQRPSPGHLRRQRRRSNGR
ncbi:MAG: hypothetical protein WDN28_08440 [Chthoniobacter sp.]